MQYHRFKLQALSLTILALSLLSACGSGFVSNAEVSSSQIDGDTYGSLKVTLASNGLMLPALQIPILDPKNPGKTLARISMTPLLGSNQTDFSAEINISRISDIQTMDGHLLPNGHAIPVGGLDKVPALAIPISNGGVVLYLAFSKTSAMLGAAINIREFSQVSKYVGGLDIFPAFKMKNGVVGVAGLYTSLPEVNKNGIAFFVDASALLNKDQGFSLQSIGSDVSSTRSKSIMAASIESKDNPIDVKLNFAGSRASRKQENRVMRGLYQISQDQRGNPVQVGW